MARFGLFTLLLLLPANLVAQAPDSSFGLKLGRVPEPLLAHLPALPKSHAVMAEAVEPNSPAWRGGIRRFDVIVSLDDQPPADPKAAEEKIRRDAGARVTLFRAGREMVLAFDANRPANAVESEYLAPKGTIKSEGPPSVSIQLQPMDNGRVHLVLTFYSTNSGKMERLAYDGPLADIEQQIHIDARDKRLPDRVQDLMEVALQRARTISKNQK